jgi:hypothetical protein
MYAAIVESGILDCRVPRLFTGPSWMYGLLVSSASEEERGQHPPVANVVFDIREVVLYPLACPLRVGWRWGPKLWWGKTGEKGGVSKEAIFRR